MTKRPIPVTLIAACTFVLAASKELLTTLSARSRTLVTADKRHLAALTRQDLSLNVAAAEVLAGPEELSFNVRMSSAALVVNSWIFWPRIGGE